MPLALRRETLRLAETFTISRSSVDTQDVVVATLDLDGVTAYGEGSPVSYWGESVDSMLDALEQDGEYLLGRDPRDIEAVARRLRAWDGPQGAKQVLDGVVHDWVGKQFGQPVWRVLGLDGVQPQTSFTIGMSDLADTVGKVRRAPGFDVYKVKVGGPGDLERLEAIRGVTDARLRIDGNEGWSLQTAEEMLPHLVSLGVEFIEQPFPAADRDSYLGYRKLPGRIPVLIDEGCKDLASVPDIAGYADGIVIKLAKCGGIREALRMVHTARALDLQVMLGCMIESQLGIVEAAQLGSLADHVDLDGHLLITDSPFTGLGLTGGRVVLTDAPGLGVTPAAAKSRRE
ncbi:MAG TPA: dipeptide epimerase [Nocardioidaceae bacterium]|nr:dipeptide epimerase [Nocardioidaceae bacterium]